MHIACTALRYKPVFVNSDAEEYLFCMLGHPVRTSAVSLILYVYEANGDQTHHKCLIDNVEHEL